MVSRGHTRLVGERWSQVFLQKLLMRQIESAMGSSDFGLIGKLLQTGTAFSDENLGRIRRWHEEVVVQRHSLQNLQQRQEEHDYYGDGDYDDDYGDYDDYTDDKDGDDEGGSHDKDNDI